MPPKSRNNTSIASPVCGIDGFVTGWFKFEDEYLCPEVIYGSWPPITSIKLGGRVIESDRAVSVKIKLLKPDEDQIFWCGKKQHCDRVNLGEYHRDFGDAEVAYSFSSPQTHIYFSGYSIHFEAFENLSFISYNATARVIPQHVFGDGVFLGQNIFEFNGSSPIGRYVRKTTADKKQSKIILESFSKGSEILSSRSTSAQSNTRKCLISSHLDRFTRSQDSATRSRNLQQDEKSCYFPLYSCQIPVVREGLAGRETVDYQFTAQHLNDCDRDITLRDEFNVGVGISALSSPASVPPVYPPLRPFEVPEMIFSHASTKGGRHITEVLQPKRLEERLHHVERGMPLLDSPAPSYQKMLNKNPFSPYWGRNCIEKKVLRSQTPESIGKNCVRYERPVQVPTIIQVPFHLSATHQRSNCENYTCSINHHAKHYTPTVLSPGGNLVLNPRHFTQCLGWLKNTH